MRCHFKNSLPALLAGCWLVLWPAWCQGGETAERGLVLCLTKAGLKNYVQPREAMQVFDALVREYMVPELKFPVCFHYYEDDRQMYQAIARKQADLGCGDLTKFLAQYQKGLVKPLVWFQQNRPAGRPEGDRYVLVVRKDSGITRLEQLRGKRLGINDSQDLKIITCLFFGDRPGFQPNAFFSQIRPFESCRDSIYSLFFNTADVVFESEYSWEVFTRLRPELSGASELLPVKSGPLADLPIFFRASLEPEQNGRLEKMKEFFLRMHEDPGKHDMLIFLGCDRVMPVTEKQDAAYRAWTKKYQEMGLIP